MKLGVQWPGGAWRHAGLNLLFPARCAYCDADLTGLWGPAALCGNCSRLLGPGAWPSCSRCGAALDSGEGRLPARCGRCKDRHFGFDHVVPLGAYRDTLRSAVLKMKRRDGDPLSAAMALVYSQQRGEALRRFRPDAVVAVPMYWSRRLLRGTNSPDTVARHLARQLAVPLAPRMLVRCRNTLPQAELTPQERFENVRGAFRVRAGYDLDGATVVVVDDILTTGATCSEVARVLKGAGAARVVAAILARAEGPQRS